jgi:DNA-3-methyladenine glycosylase
MTRAALAVLAAPAPMSAPALLGATLTGKGVTLRITEVEAYFGPTDPGSHGHRGMTDRNRNLFGPAGTLYAYRSYGIHTCVNVVSGDTGTSSGALLRGAEVLDGVDVARGRRGMTVSDVQLARGPGNLGAALGAVLGTDDGTSVRARPGSPPGGADHRRRPRCGPRPARLRSGDPPGAADGCRRPRRRRGLPVAVLAAR